MGQEGLVVPPSSPSAPSLRRRHFHRRSSLPERLADGIAQLAVKFNANLDSAMQKRADAGYGLEVRSLENVVVVFLLDRFSSGSIPLDVFGGPSLVFIFADWWLWLVFTLALCSVGDLFKL